MKKLLDNSRMTFFKLANHVAIKNYMKLFLDYDVTRILSEEIARAALKLLKERVDKPIFLFNNYLTAYKSDF